MTYSIDFRQKVLLIKEQEKLTVAETAVRFGIGVASITRWDKRLEPQLFCPRKAQKKAPIANTIEAFLIFKATS